ncbi:hypothetical protein PFICI_02079 [Pestalotiopsis fici W106-1]|uniref:NACHT domain-containing protein n=1 Tax=Pestalotiopsis fici (strain W106-1 / CGMCC3.15140) TaxID=1229662 RepID=W3XSS7_PESFW|nr:uncharacterized protein PFICI_02079 [Pestalotiopsis fici W106-1]ETS88251.1 hypothetical protein PFICI_02079 [Pestalotiopsis fici W106-1]
MDPLSAFALAGTVYTFIDAGITATKFAKELSGFWKSSRDTVKSLEHLTITTQNLEELSSKLRHANGPRYMMSIATECTTSCQELLDLLDKLKVKDKGSKTEHLLAMLSAYRKKDEISLIEDKLGKLRAQMTLDLLRALNDGQSDIKGKLDEIQNDIVKLSETRHGSFRARRAGLLDLLQAYKQNQDQDHSAIINELRNFGSEVYHERVFNSILKTLRFDSMYLREDNTSEAGEGTFRWLFDKQERFKATNPRSNNMPPQKFQETRDAFMMWLESGEGVFHICGKAGSGKSTLMKLICNDKQTRNALNAWAEGDTLLWANFFFFAPGEKEVKSLEGLYRFVLFTILNEHRHLIRKIYPDEFPEEFKEFRHDRQLAYELADLVRPPKLREAFQSLIDVTVADKHKMCIFIDGLDEYEGSYTDYWQLADNLRNWAHQSCARVKFCVSSRPEVQFESTFSSKNAPTIRQIHLHEFTSGDIEKYCRDQFTKTSNSKMIPNYDNFIDHIVTKAQGVFLWAVLVTKELLFETRITHSAKDLWRKLDELPDELHELYQKLFDSMGEAQRRRCCRILLTVLTNPFKDPINAQSLNWIYDEEDLDQALLRQLQCSETHGPEQHVNRVVDHLNEWTRGFVEAIAWDQSTETSTSLTNLPHFHTRVRLFHKTVKDYMDSSKLSMLQSEFPGFDVVKTHVQLRLLELGIVNAQYKENHVF